MANSDFLPFAIGGGANVEAQVDYVADPNVPTGFQAGTALSSKCNKVWRQSSFVSAAVAQAIMRATNADVLDDGNLAAFVTKLEALYAQSAIVPPQGILTPTSGTPVIAANATNITTLFWTPFKGNLLPFHNGVKIVARPSAEIQLALNANHTVGNLYDILSMVDPVSGNAMLVTSQPWANAGLGAGARGVGGTTPQIVRDAATGLWLNANAMVVRNGGTTYNLPALQGVLLGTLWIDAIAGQVNLQVTGGQNRVWGLSNAWNRRPVELRVFDPNSSWTYGTIAWRPARNDANNCFTTLCCLPEEIILVDLLQIVGAVNGNESEIAIGINSTSVPTDFEATVGLPGQTNTLNQTLLARARLQPGIGLNKFTALESIESGTGASVFFGTIIAMDFTGRFHA